MTIELPDELVRCSESRYWGVDPVSILLANNVLATDGEEWSPLRRYYDLAVYLTNFEPEWSTYRDTLCSICEGWLKPPMSELAVCADAASATQYIVGAAYQSDGGILRALRRAQDERHSRDRDEPVIVSRRELRGFTSGDDIRLLRSLGILQSRTDGYQFDREVLVALEQGHDLSREEAAWALLRRVFESLGITHLRPVVEQLFEQADMAVPDSRPAAGKTSLPVSLGNRDLSAVVELLTAEDLSTLIADRREEIGSRRTRLRESLQFATSDRPTIAVDWPIDDPVATVCAVASQRDLPVAAKWAAELLDTDPYTLLRRLRNADIDANLADEQLRFGEGYTASSSNDSALEQYQLWIETELDRLEESGYALEEASERLGTGWERQRRSLLEATLQRLNGHTVSPIRFVYTMFDPVHHADEYDIEQYVGDSPHLEDEVRRIREWREHQPHDATPFSEAVPEVCNFPLEHEDVEPHLRIMSPWMNFAIQDYTALFGRLLKNDVQIRLLLRLPGPRDWNNLKRNLLTRLGDTDDNLELRTYTRYKRYHDHTELREIKRGESDTENVSETGVHAKIFIAGAPENGAVLTGSANLMENSFFYNPEAGLHTRHPQVIRTAADHFDLIWELAEPDRIDESVYTRRTNFEFYPKVYRP